MYMICKQTAHSKARGRCKTESYRITEILQDRLGIIPKCDPNVAQMTSLEYVLGFIYTRSDNKLHGFAVWVV